MIQFMTFLLASAVGITTMSIINRRFMGVFYLPGILLGLAGSFVGVTFTYFVLGIANDLGGNVVGAFAGCFALYYSLRAVGWSFRNIGAASAIVSRFVRVYWLGAIVALATFAICRFLNWPLWPVLVTTLVVSQTHWILQGKTEFMNAWRNPKQIPAAFRQSMTFIRYGSTPPAPVVLVTPTAQSSSTPVATPRRSRRSRGSRP